MIEEALRRSMQDLNYGNRQPWDAMFIFVVLLSFVRCQNQNSVVCIFNASGNRVASDGRDNTSSGTMGGSGAPSNNTSDGGDSA